MKNPLTDNLRCLSPLLRRGERESTAGLGGWYQDAPGVKKVFGRVLTIPAPCEKFRRCASESRMPDERIMNQKSKMMGAKMPPFAPLSGIAFTLTERLVLSAITAILPGTLLP